jgi:hypothetical protein
LALISSVAQYWAGGGGGFILRSFAVVASLVLIYAALHVLIRRFCPGIHRWVGAILALVPVAFFYVLGIGGGPIFGAGEGQLGALTFLGLSMLIASVRGDYGCEVMTIPALIFGRRTHLACIVFSPLDWLEQTSRSPEKTG